MWPFNLECVQKSGKRIASTWNAWHMMGHFWKAREDLKCQCSALLSGLWAISGEDGSLTENELFPEKSQKQAGDTAPCNDEEKLVPIAMELRIRCLGWAKRLRSQSQKDDPSHQHVPAAFFGHTSGQIPCHVTEI